MKLAERVSQLSPSPTMAVSAEASRRRASGQEVIDFSIGEPDFNTPDNIKNEGHQKQRRVSCLHEWLKWYKSYKMKR